MKLCNLLALSSLTLASFVVGCQKQTPDFDPSRKPPVVNAGAAQNISLPTESVVLSGTATDSGSKIVSWLWSEVSGPNVPIFSDEGSPSTQVNGLIMGQYVFQLTATDTFGLTGVGMVQVTVGLDSAVLTADSVNSMGVEYIGNATQDFSNNANIELGAETWTISGSTVAVRSVFRFDMTSLPNTPVRSATLSIYSDPTPNTANLTTPNYGTGNAFYIQRVSSSWTPSGATWATQPTVDSAGEVLLPQTNASSLDLIGIDVTAIVNKMISSGHNYGFEMRLQNEVIYNSRIFCGGAYPNASKRPQLVIHY